MEMKKIGRKKFFERVGKISIFSALATLLPVKFLSAKELTGSKVKVKIHPSAVKRNKVS